MNVKKLHKKLEKMIQKGLGDSKVSILIGIKTENPHWEEATCQISSVRPCKKFDGDDVWLIPKESLTPIKGKT